jgi:hypothetical protein
MPLLRFGQHDRTASCRSRAAAQRDVDLDADAAARSRLATSSTSARARPCPARRRTRRCHHLEARLEQQLLHERIADLHGGPLLADFSSNSADAIVAP